MRELRAIQVSFAFLMLALSSVVCASTLERFNEASDDLSSVLVTLDSSERSQERIIERLSDYVGRDFTNGNLSSVLSLAHKAYFYYSGDSIIAGWCAEAVRNAIGGDGAAMGFVKHLAKQSSSLNSVEAIISIKILEELIRDQHQNTEEFKNLVNLLQEHSDETVSRLAGELGSGRSPKDLKLEFERKFEELSSHEDAAGDVQVVGFEIAEDFSIHQETRAGRVREFEPSSRYRTFFTNTGGESPFARPSDYGDLIEISNKLARKEALTKQEDAFLERAKPVFLVTVKNESQRQVVLEAIVLVVRDIDRVLGGGSRILQPDVMYEVEVPTEEGTFFFPIKENKLLIEAGGVGQFYLGLNSTNKQVLPNGAVIFPQIQYELEIYFHFGSAGEAKIRHLRVLL